MDKFVLYADDDEDDRTLIQEACKAVDAQLTLSFLENGRQVLDLLQSLPASELPSLIILDMNMPQLDGRQTLQKLKSQQQYKHIPVAIVSTSSSLLDHQTCRHLGADLFLSKPGSYAEWQTIIRQLISLINQPF